MYKTCGIFGEKDATDIQVQEEMTAAVQSRTNKCTNLYTDCGVPVLSSIPVVNVLFPRECVTEGDLKRKAMEAHAAKIKAEQDKWNETTYILSTGEDEFSSNPEKRIVDFQECVQAAKYIKKSRFGSVFTTSFKNSRPYGCFIDSRMPTSRYYFNDNQNSEIKCSNSTFHCVIKDILEKK